jgi:hypothetical protein
MAHHESWTSTDQPSVLRSDKKALQVSDLVLLSRQQSSSTNSRSNVELLGLVEKKEKESGSRESGRKDQNILEIHVSSAMKGLGTASA